VLSALERRGRALTTPAALAADLGVGRGAHKGVRGALRKLESEGGVERIRGRFRARRPGDDRLEGIFQHEGRATVVVDDTGRHWRVGSDGDATPGIGSPSSPGVIRPGSPGVIRPGRAPTCCTSSRALAITGSASCIAGVASPSPLS
jgi:hypothetical protein